MSPCGVLPMRQYIAMSEYRRPREVLSKSHIGSGNLVRRLRIEATYPL